MHVVPDYVNRVLDSFEHITETSDGWLACCPVFGHGEDAQDDHPSLRITIGSEGRILVHCRVGCTLAQVLEAADPPLSIKDLYPPPGAEPAAPLVDQLDASTLSDLEVQLRHYVYSHFLDCLSLSEQHQQDLLARGLDLDTIRLHRFRTLPAASNLSAGQALYERVGSALYDVPGFARIQLGQTEQPRVHCNASGLLIPIRNQEHYIVALKLRKSTEPKYIYLSGPDHLSGSPIFHPAVYPTSTSKVRLTEGELKATVATLKTGTYTLGIPGVALWADVLPDLERLNPTQVVVAFDWPDVLSKRPVLEATIRCIDALHLAGYQVLVEHWDPEFKGIDDALVAGQTIQTTSGPQMQLILKQRLIEIKLEEPKIEEWQPEEFPLSFFPEPIQDYLTAVAASLPCAIDFPAVSALVTAGACLGTSTCLRIKNRWPEFGNLWAVLVGAPGTKKTPGIKQPVSPLRKIDHEATKQFEQEWVDYEKKKLVYKAEESFFKSQLKKYHQQHAYWLLHPDAEHPGAEPQFTATLPSPPRQKQITVDDVTMESLAKIWDANPRGLLFFNDEILSWTNKMNVYRGGKGDDRQKFLKTWSLDEIKVNRSGLPKPITVPIPFLSILGTIQPDLIHELGDAKGREDGFLNRILFAMPNTEVSEDFDFDLDISEDITQVWHACVAQLLSFPCGDKPREIRLNSKAQDAWKAWYREHIKETQSPCLSRHFQATWNKMLAHCGRFILISHCLRQVCQDPHSEEGFADEEDVRRAILLVNYFKCHASGVAEQMRFDDLDHNLREFRAWVQEQGGQVSFRDVYRLRRWGIKGKKEATAFLENATNRGYGSRKTMKGKNGKEVTYFVLHDGPGGDDL